MIPVATEKTIAEVAAEVTTLNFNDDTTAFLTQCFILASAILSFTARVPASLTARAPASASARPGVSPMISVDVFVLALIACRTPYEAPCPIYISIIMY